MLARGLSGLLLFSVEGHLDFRQGKLNASSEIRDPKSESPWGIFSRRSTIKHRKTQSFIKCYLRYICTVFPIMRTQLQTERFFCVTGSLVYRSFPLCSSVNFANKRCHFAGQYRGNSLLSQSKFQRYHKGRGT